MDLLRLWQCSKCGVIGRHLHRYIAPHDDKDACTANPTTLSYALELQWGLRSNQNYWVPPMYALAKGNV